MLLLDLHDRLLFKLARRRCGCAVGLGNAGAASHLGLAAPSHASLFSSVVVFSAAGAAAAAGLSSEPLDLAASAASLGWIISFCHWRVKRIR